MNREEFFKMLKENRLISEIWNPVLQLVEDQIVDKREDHDAVMKLLTIYFSLIDDGNACIPLDEENLKEKWTNKLVAAKASFQETNESDEKNDGIQLLMEESEKLITQGHLDSLKKLDSIVGDRNQALDKLFCVEDGWLFLQKYWVACLGLSESIPKLFAPNPESEESSGWDNKSIDDILKRDGAGIRSLTDKQKKIVTNGVNKNLIITGGPGTGKTTSILFLLLNILCSETELPLPEIYLVAASGKAASRMKESIEKGFGSLTEEFKEEHDAAIKQIQKATEYTIHRFLGQYEYNDPFQKDRSRVFDKEAIVIIDEASMIDICLFDALLKTVVGIEKKRVFIMGDKNQLPAVGAGAVFADLITSVQTSVIELDESVRFGENTEIYKLARLVNDGNVDEQAQWQPATGFAVQPPAPDRKPVYYYLDHEDGKPDKEIVETIAKRWGDEYYSQLKGRARIQSEDEGTLNALFKMTEKGKILCAENRGTRGVDAFNAYLKNNFTTPVPGSLTGDFAPGQLVMITKNNSALDLWNGDSGIVVKFENDALLYLMVKKQTAFQQVKAEGKIFRLFDFTFYPLRMIARSDITLAYAITIHKSQGSDYDNILVVLPKYENNPLLKRQIVYTAITRTKGNTYIVSNGELFGNACKNVIERDTRLAKLLNGDNA